MIHDILLYGGSIAIGLLFPFIAIMLNQVSEDHG